MAGVFDARFLLEYEDPIETGFETAVAVIDTIFPDATDAQRNEFVGAYEAGQASQERNRGLSAVGAVLHMSQVSSIQGIGKPNEYALIALLGAMNKGTEVQQ